MTRVFLIVVAVTLLGARAAHAQPNANGRCASGTEVVRVGFTTFQSATNLSADRSWYEGVKEYLRSVSGASRRSTEFDCPIEFEVHLGNYYQMLAWFRSGEVDAAVVSAFVAYLLESESSGIPIVEFAEHEDPKAAGHVPLVAASIDGEPSDEPVREWESFLCLTTAEAEQAIGLPPRTDCASGLSLRDFDLNAVAHLSASSFVFPVLRARFFIEQYLAKKQPRLDENVRPKLLGAYWERLFDRVRFHFSHNARPSKVQGRPRQLRFSYSGLHPEYTASPAPGEDRWAPYGLDEGAGWIIPRDVLILSSNALAHRALASANAWPRETLPGKSAQAYTRALPLTQGTRDAFRRDIGCAFGYGGQRKDFECATPADPALARAYDHWFHDGRYGFTVDDVLALLRQDQENSGQDRLALVLPGGGVKAAYQSRLLDALYADSLVNVGTSRDSNHDATAAGQIRLKVDTVTGTSGGAMVGVFAAREPTVRPLTQLWIEAGKVRARASDIFPLLGILRFIGLYGMLLILQLGLLVLFWFRRHEPPPDPAPKRVTALLALAVMLGPWAIRSTLSQAESDARQAGDWALLAEFGSYIPFVEAFFYGVVVCLAHFAWTCSVRRESGKPSVQSWRDFIETSWRDFVRLFGGERRRQNDGVPNPTVRALMAVCWGAAVAAVLIAVFAPFGSSRFTSFLHVRIFTGAVLVAFAVAMVAVATTLLAWRGSAVAEMQGVRQYLRSVVIILGIVVASFTLLIGATHRGWATLLEITGEYWEWTLYTSSAVIIAVMVVQHVAALRGKTSLADAFRYLATRHTFMGRSVMRIESLLLVNGLAILLWAAFVTPALYDDVNALAYFKQQLEPEFRSPSGRFTANLIVTGTSLEPIQVGEARLLPGDQYFCFKGPSGCPENQPLRWNNVAEGNETNVVDPVFASGSPFPVLPGHSVQQGELKGRFVDGGYAHNTPLRAALIAGARQALVVYSSPREGEQPPREAKSRLSQLASNAMRLLPFMFDQSQGSDRDVGSALMVASLAPMCNNEPFPFLADFRPSVVQHMVDCAESDLQQHRRIGRIDSWGRPHVYSRIAGPLVEMKPIERGWDPNVLGELVRRLREVEDNRSMTGIDAAFDMDNTLIKNDFGEALLRELIVNRAFSGSDAFWSLVEDTSERGAIRHLSDVSAASCKDISIEDVDHWQPECRDFFVAVWKRYERLLAVPGGHEVAYAWAAQTLVGLKPEGVEQFALRVWDAEVKRQVRKVTIKSSILGTVEVNVGLRLFPQMENLVGLLRGRRWNVWIVSASTEYVARVVAKKLGIGSEHVLAIQSKTGKDGLITAEIRPPITYRKGKVEALTDAGVVGDLGFAAGDSEGDIDMLESSPVVALVVDRGAIPDSKMNSRWLRQPVFKL